MRNPRTQASTGLKRMLTRRGVQYTGGVQSDNSIDLKILAVSYLVKHGKSLDKDFEFAIRLAGIESRYFSTAKITRVYAVNGKYKGEVMAYRIQY